MNVQQVRAINLGSRMAGQRERQVIFCHATAVILDADQCLATIRIVDTDTTRARVDCVLDQFLDGGGWSLNHFSSRNTIDCAFVKLPDNWAIFAYIGVSVRHTAILSIAGHDSETAFLHRFTKFEATPWAAVYLSPP